MKEKLRKFAVLVFLPLLLLMIFSGFSIKSFFLTLTGSLVPQPLPKLSATQNGTLSSNVEIVLPPGTKGIVPNLSLSYSSGGKNGILGVGWNLSGIYSISRDPSFGINFDNNDKFLSDQVGPLTDISGNKTKYHSRKESWVRFVPSGVCGSGPCSWTATDKDGIVYSYGKTNDSRIEALGKNGAIRNWALNQVRDPFGNGYDITYIEDPITGEYYPNEIKYQNRSIKFEYSSSRTDSSPSYVFGSLVQTTKRLDEIEIYADGTLLRNYELEYSSGPSTGRQILTSLKRNESNIFGSESYDDLDFNYGSDGFLVQPLADTNLNTPTSTVNLFVPSALLMYANLYFGNPLPTQPTATEKRLATYLQYAMHIPVPDRDVCNNGASACLCAAYAPCWGGNPNFFAILASMCLDYNNWGGPNYCASGIDSGLTYWTPMDLDGNGILDFASIVGSENSNTIRLRAWKVQNGTVDPNGSFLSPILPLHYNTFFQTVDLDGDGRTDFAYESGGKLNVIYSQSNSFSSPVNFSNVAIPAASQNMQAFRPYSYFYEYSTLNPKRMIADKPQIDWFADMNSDNLADFIHYDGTKFNIYLNQKGSFSNAIQITGTSNYFINEFMDLDLDGKAEHVRLVQYSQNPQYTSVSNQLQAANEQAETITNEFHTKEDILNSILNNGVSSVSNSDFYSLIDYYLTGCGYYIANSGSGGNILQVPNSSGQNVSCIDVDPNYIDVTQLQAAKNGTPIPSTNTLFNDLQVVYAKTLGPVTTTQTNLQNQLNALNASANGTIRYRLDVTTFNLTSQTSTVAQYDLGTSADRLRSFFGDVNSDSLPDFVTIVGNQIKVSLNTNHGFAAQVTSSLNASSVSNTSQSNFSDVNSDGLEDLVLYNKETKTVESYLSNGAGSLTYNSNFGFGQFDLNEQTSGGVYKADQGQFIIQDMNGDGSKDALLIKLWQDKTQGHILAKTTNPKVSNEDDLISVTNGIQTTTVGYTTKQLHPGAIQAGSGNYPNIPDISNTHLVTNITTDLGSGVSIGESFEYKNSRFYLGVREVIRSLGFASVKEKDNGTGFYRFTEYNQTDYRLAGVPTTFSNYNASGNLMQQTINSGFQFPNPLGTEIAVAANISKSSYHNGNLEVSTNTAYTLDQYGFPTNQTETAGSHTISTDIEFSHDLNSWRIGRMTRNKKTINGLLVQDQKLVYQGDAVQTATQFLGTSAEQNTNYTYDSFGNPITITDTSNATSTISYDAVIHSFPLEKNNALGHKETINYDLNSGLEISKTDPNGGVTSKTYDALGRLLQVTYPGSQNWNESYEYTNTGKFDLANFSNTQSVSKTIRDTTSGLETKITEYSDPLGNVLRTVSDTAVTGITLITDSLYNYQTGLAFKKSNPYFSNTSPFWTEYKYEDPDYRSTGTIHSDSKGLTTTTVSYSGLTVNTSISAPDGIVKTFSETKNELGQVVSKTDNGKTILTNYSPNGQPSQITDPTGLVTNFVFGTAGRRISVTDPSSGTISYTYDPMGRILQQTDARNKNIQFSYDTIGRIISTQTNGGETPIVNEYDAGQYGIGRVTKITDSSGVTEISYNIQGKPIRQIKTIDGYQLITEMEYDSLGRLIIITYPDGSKVYQSYSLNGNLENVTLDSPDGGANGILVAQYEGPIFVDGNPIFRKTTGNGVVTDLKLDLSNFQTLSLSSKKDDGSILQSISYDYDGSGNIAQQTDNQNTSRNQTYTYDLHSRLLSAVGSYGTQNYTYNAGGNLTQKGNVNFTYGDSNHPHSITNAASGQSSYNYTYDAAGNMISRNGDVLVYDSFSKLIEYQAQDGTTIKYTYDYSGNRVKSENLTTTAITYNTGDYYEIVKSNGSDDQHTMYIKGLGGEILTQITRPNASLVTLDENTKIGLANSSGTWMEQTGLCSGVIIDCGTYWKNRIISPISKFFAYSAFFRDGIPTIAFRLGYILFILGMFYLAYPFLLRGNEILKGKKITGLSTPVLLISIFGVSLFQDCNGLLGGKAPWFTLKANMEETSSFGVKDNNAGTPAIGGYFYQRDHLGSTTMLTDGYGNQVAGPGQSGVSYVSYLPYGEINLSESTGPDIFHYKFTGQILDSDTGLYYYKSRYYDPHLGRFIQADDRSDKGINGLNRYMYVGGNPVNRIDPNGHSWLSNALKIKSGSFLQRALFVNSKRWASAGNLLYNAGSVIGGTALLAGMVGFAPVFLQAGVIANPKAFKHNFGQATNAYFRSLADFGVSSVANPILGDPRPRYEISRGAFIIHNSYEANHGLFKRNESLTLATTEGPYVRLRNGSSNVTYNHELVHVRQWYANSTTNLSGFGDPNEHEADLFSGTNSYLTWTLLYQNGFISKTILNQINDLNIIYSLKSDLLYLLILRRNIDAAL
ncbi:RHS repeat-associated core domain-containing protein [Leptospira dzoumogneensis]|uniref:RHS repeat-associated core domain-containing protein n=1 Tax=Leptospira dzoumogneensis TaxID=2484904 RepID=UPI001FCA5F4D|nr:RHS repeat-associated core domain-containing protein [Leptospira dzoumogneensis]